MIPHPHDLSLKPGLIQVQGKGNNLKTTHDPKTGWKLNYPNPPVKIYIQDELTFVNGKMLEIENYIKQPGVTFSQKKQELQGAPQLHRGYILGFC